MVKSPAAAQIVAMVAVLEECREAISIGLMVADQAGEGNPDVVSEFARPVGKAAWIGPDYGRLARLACTACRLLPGIMALRSPCPQPSSQRGDEVGPTRQTGKNQSGVFGRVFTTSLSESREGNQQSECESGEQKGLLHKGRSGFRRDRWGPWLYCDEMNCADPKDESHFYTSGRYEVYLR
jgi:hypothetical protein